MTSEHIKTKHKLKDICEVKTFESLLDLCTLTDDDKLILRMHYLQGKTFAYIADQLGYAESTVKQRHRKVLHKITKLL